MLCGGLYLRRHNLICTYIHWAMLEDLGAKVTDTWTKHKPTMSTTVGDVVLTYDQSIPTDRKVAHNKPDLVWWNKKERKALIIDVAVPMDRNVVRNIAEKLTNYRDLEIEV